MRLTVSACVQGLPTTCLRTGLRRYSEVKADIKESEFDGFTWTEVRLQREPPHKGVAEQPRLLQAQA